MRQGTFSGQNEIMRQALAGATRDRTTTYMWPALVATTEGDRALLKSILLAAERRNERWAKGGLRLHIERAWSQDREIMAGLARRKPQADVQT
jgi:hypothetical protein